MRSFSEMAKLIKNSRENRATALSQSQLSKLLGYKNGQFISNVERGLCNIPLKMVYNVSGVLDIPIDELKQALTKDFEDTIENYLKVSEEKKDLKQ